MDIEHPAAPALYKPRRQQPHESGKADQIDPLRAKLFIKRAIERLTVGTKLCVIDDRGRDAGLARAREARRIGTVGNDNRDFGRIVFRRRRLDQGRHV